MCAYLPLFVFPPLSCKRRDRQNKRPGVPNSIFHTSSLFVAGPRVATIW